MAKTSIAQLKLWFQTSLKPTQTQFWNWLDSFRHLDTPIGISDLSTDLQNTINNIAASPLKFHALPAGTATYQMPAGFLFAVLMYDAANPAVGVGLSNADTAVYDAQQLVNGLGVSSGFYPFGNSTTIYFACVTANTVLIIVYI